MTPIVESTVVDKVKNPSYAKFMQFGFWLSTQIPDDTLRDSLVKTLKLHDSVEDQILFYKSFLDNTKDVAKSLRANVAETKKLAKAQAKAEAKAIARAEAKAAKAASKPPRAPRAKRNKNIADAPTDLISQLVSLANSEDPLPANTHIPSVVETIPVVQPLSVEPNNTTTNTNTKTKTKTKKTSNKKIADSTLTNTNTPSVVETTTTSVDTKKTQEKKTKKTKNAVEPTSTTTVTHSTPSTPSEKPKRTYNKKSKNDSPPTTLVTAHVADSNTNPAAATDAADDDELDVEIVTIDGVKFLKDSDNNLYDFLTHLPI